MELLFFFECQCRGVKFYDLRSAGARYGTSLKLVCEPTNLQDPLNCVAAWVPGPWSSGHRASFMLGHVAKEAARWLNPLLDSCFRVTSYVVSEPYSMVLRNRNWRYRVVDIHVFVNGPSHMLPQLQEILEGRKADLPGLTFGPFDKYSGLKLDNTGSDIDKDTSTTPTIQQQTHTPDSPSPLTALNITTQDVMNTLFPDSPLTSTNKDVSTALSTTETHTPDSPSPLTALNITTQDVMNALFPDSPPSSTNSSLHNPIPNQTVNITTQDMWDALLIDTPPASTDNSPSYVYPLPPTSYTEPDVLDTIFFPPMSP